MLALVLVQINSLPDWRREERLMLFDVEGDKMANEPSRLECRVGGVGIINDPLRRTNHLTA
jgi:hypothetical protein